MAHRAHRRGGDRRLARGRVQPQFLARSAPRVHACRASRWPQAGAVHARVYRDLNDNGVRDAAEPFEKGALITTGTAPGRAADRCQGLGHRRRPHRLHAGHGRNRRRPASTIRCWRRKKALQVVVPRPGFRPRSRSAWSAAATSKARSSRAAGSASKGSISSWSTRRARSSPPRAPISTASSCSNACAYGSYRVPRGAGLGRAPRSSSPISASRVDGHSGQVGRAAGRDPRRASAVTRVGRRPRPARLLRLSTPARARPRMLRMRCDWCGRENSNFHGLSATATSTLRVYQFRHDRTS